MVINIFLTNHIGLIFFF